MADTRSRGRPRQYDPQQALSAALGEFRHRGYTATSLDHLSQATGMKRPSLYAAFGNKREIYVKAVENFRENQMVRQNDILFDKQPLEACLRAYFEAIINSYVPNDRAALGCPVMSVITSEAAADVEIATELVLTIKTIDACFRRRLQIAGEAGEIPPNTDTQSLAQLLAGLQHSLALRARAGTTSEKLSGLASRSLSYLLEW